MKKKPATPKRPAVAKAKPGDLAALITEVRDLIQSARRSVASVVDTFQVMTNFEIGRRIVEHEQKGAKRATYGAELLKELSGRLTEEFGRGFSVTNLKLMRQFFMENQFRIGQKASDQLSLPSSKGQSVTDQLSPPSSKGQSATGQLAISQSVNEKSGSVPFLLSWTHYVELLGIKNPDERSFYEIESRQSNWNVRELKRQKASCLYERLALGRDKEGIKRLASEGQLITKPEDLFKEPLVLEFLGLDEQARYSESDLETFRFTCHPKNCSAKSSSIGPARQRHKPTRQPKGLNIPNDET
jgi:hypothetical protein